MMIAIATHVQNIIKQPQLIVTTLQVKQSRYTYDHRKVYSICSNASAPTSGSACVIIIRNSYRVVSAHLYDQLFTQYSIMCIAIGKSNTITFQSV